MEGLVRQAEGSCVERKVVRQTAKAMQYAAMDERVGSIPVLTESASRRGRFVVKWGRYGDFVRRSRVKSDRLRRVSDEARALLRAVRAMIGKTPGHELVNFGSSFQPSANLPRIRPF